MATFSSTHAHAYHVLPLHSAKAVWHYSALFSKLDLQSRGLSFRRRTTAATDTRLGFADVVHFYLPKGPDLRALRILAAQLGPTSVPPFPHLVLRLPTDQFDDAACIVCCWNIAVGRPKCGGVRPGNWTRGTNPERIAAVWKQFQAEAPTMEKARGSWRDGRSVPVLTGSDIRDGLRVIAAHRGVPELLLRSPVALNARKATCLTFSARDRDLLRLLGPPPAGVEIEAAEFPTYGTAVNQPDGPVYETIERYFRSGDLAPPPLDYDGRRQGTGAHADEESGPST